MKTLALPIFALALALALALATAGAAHAAPPGPADEAALRALAASADEAWDLKDHETMAGYYAEDASLFVGGLPAAKTGRAEVRAYFAQAFAQRPGVMRHVGEVRAIDMLGPDTALTDLWVKVEAQQPDGGWKEVRRFANLSVATRTDGGWKLRVVRAYPVG